MLHQAWPQHGRGTNWLLAASNGYNKRASRWAVLNQGPGEQLMADGFDPYHKWLGIPPAEQPPHHYRLLGIALFESDPDVIEHAADRQMAHVRSLATGKYAQHTQKLLNELAAAKVCLLSPKEKAGYDEALRARLRSAEASAAVASNTGVAAADAAAASVVVVRPPAAPVAPLAQPMPLVRPGETGLEAALTSPAFDQPAGLPLIASEPSATARLRRSQRAAWLLWASLGGVAVLGAVVVLWLARSGGSDLLGDASTTHPSNPPNAQNVVQGSHGGQGAGGAPSHPPDASDNASNQQRPTKPPRVKSQSPTESIDEQVQRLVSQLGGRVQRANGNETVVMVDLAGRSAARGDALRLIGQLTELRELRLNGTGISDADLQHLHRLVKLEKLHLGGTAISDEGVAHLQPLAGLRELRLPFTRITAAGLGFVARCERLEVLDLTDADLRGGHLRQLAGLRGLRELVLHRCQLDAKDIQALAAFPALERLSLNGAVVEDAVVEPLAALRGLKYLDLRGIRLTASALANVREGLRDAQVLADPPTDVAQREPAGVQQPRRAAVPDDATIEKNQELVRNELFRDEYALAKNAHAKQQLAQRLLEKAEQTRDDPGSRYVLLQEARRLAADAGAIDVLLRALDALADQFEVDGLALRAESMAEAGKNVSAPDGRTQLATAALEAAEACMAESRFSEARVLLGTARNLASRLADAELKREIAARFRELDDTEEAFAAAEQARQALQADPNDAQAHLKLGRYLCLARGEWEQGLPHLAQGSDEPLRRLAELEASRPASSEAQVSLADAWYDYSRKQQGVFRTRTQERAVFWYRRALPSASGLAKEKIERRLAELEGSQNVAVTDALDLAARGARVYLSDLPELRVQTADTDPFSKGTARFSGGRPRPLRVRNTETPHGLLLVPPSNGFSSVSYRLGKRASEFRAEVGIADGPHDAPRTGLVFEVWADGRLMARSLPIIRKGQTQPVAVKVSRVEILELRVMCSGEGINAFAVWVEPHVVRR